MHEVRSLAPVRLEDGGDRAVEEHTLSSPRLTVRLVTLGATLRSVEPAPGVNAVLGYDSLADHLGAGRGSYFGATVGRFANRIGGAAFTLDGAAVRLAANEGPNQLHGGPVGFDRHVWDVHAAESTADGARVRLGLTSPAGDQGYPGTLDATVDVTVDGDTLGLVYEATTDAPTVVNLTGHPYWNLAGDGRSVLDHELQVAAAAYLPVDGAKIPTGEIAGVAGSPLDLRRPARIGDVVAATGGIDLCYVLDGDFGGAAGGAVGGDRARRTVAVLADPGSGRWLSLATDQPGLQVYTGDHLGEPFVRHGGLCLEPERFPDAPNHPDFPTAVLRPGDVYRHTTELRFGTGSPPWLGGPG